MEPVFASRGSVGLVITSGIEKQVVVYEQKIDRKGTVQERGQAQKQIKCHQFSPNGKFYAYCDGESTTILSTLDWKPYLVLSDVHHAKNSALHFSPESNYFCCYQPLFTTRKGQEQTVQQLPNLKILDFKNNKLVAEFLDKNRQKWQPLWTNDEKICARLVGSELLFHENNNFIPGSYSHKLVIPRMADYSLSGPSDSLHVAAYVPVSNDTPAVVKIFRYPHFNAPIAAKTFYKADRVNIQWNKKGTALILTAIMDIDSTGESYYGTSNLYFVSTSNDSYLVGLKKSGPVYSVEWSPNSLHYCVVYGYMPAKATLYNLKGDDIFDFGTGPRNEAHFDPFGKILALCGFGNLRGQMEFWGQEKVAKGQQSKGPTNQKRLCQFQAEDTTVFRWCPDGRHFLTATTAPRLRVNNGWKIWRYDGTRVSHSDYQTGEELWDVIWQPNPHMTEQETLTCSSQGIQGTRPSGSSTTANNPAAYVPPHMRGMTNKPAFKLHELEPSSSEKQEAIQNKANLTKNVLKNRRKVENKRAKKEEQKQTSTEIPVQIPLNPNLAQQTGDVEKDKKIRGITKKLEQIVLYKQKVANGETLELNQLDKIKNEHLLREELETLTL